MIDAHETAIDADLIRTTGFSIDDLGDRLPWKSAGAIIKTLGFDSALARDLDKNVGTWGSTLKTNYLLADIFDVLMAIEYSLVRMSGGRAQKPKPYPRPRKIEKQTYGRGAIPLNDLRDFIRKHRKGELKHD